MFVDKNIQLVAKMLKFVNIFYPKDKLAKKK